MNKKIITTLIIITIVIIFAGIWFFQKNNTVLNKRQVFKTQEECEESTGFKCSFGMCDYKCPDNNYWKGWSPTSDKLNNGSLCADSDNGKKIYTKGSAATKNNKGVTLHITEDSCATKLEKDSPSGAQYVEGLSSCSGDNCYVNEGYCYEYKDTGFIDGRDFIQCPNGCNDGACISKDGDNISSWQTYRNEEYGFELKYPADFTKQITVSDNELLSLKKTDGGGSIYFKVHIRKNYQISKITSKIKIEDQLGYKYFFQEGAGYSGVVLIQLGQDELSLIYDLIGYNRNNKISKEDFVKNNLDKILSTLKFK